MNTVLSLGVMLPLAHAGHYAIWILYAIPVLIVVAAIIRSTLIERRRARGSTERQPGCDDASL